MVEGKEEERKISAVGSSQNENQRGPFLFWNKDCRTHSLRKVGKIRDKCRM